jgi:hypothetical protein
VRLLGQGTNIGDMSGAGRVNNLKQIGKGGKGKRREKILRSECQIRMARGAVKIGGCVRQVNGGGQVTIDF